MRVRLYILLAVALLSCSCEVRYRSSVPNAPVQIEINTKEAFFVHLIPDNIGMYLIVDDEGYHMSGKTIGRTFREYYGYAGVLIYVDNNRQFSAFDCCCPNCLSKSQPTRPNGIYAVCPICGEEYDLSWGLGYPTKNVSNEALRKYNCVFSGDRLTVRN